MAICSLDFFWEGLSPHQSDLVKFTFRADPLQKAFWGTLDFEVNFTGRGYPRQKYLRGRFGELVKFTFGADPL